MKKVLLIISISLLNFPIISQNAKIVFNNLSVENGLSNSVVYSVTQDNKGYMWFGTNDKLNKYNGLKFTHYAHDPNNSNSISTNSASNIYFDDSGYLWIGTWGSGLDKLNVETDEITHFIHNPNVPSSLSDNRVQSIYKDSKGIVWVGTYKGGLNRLNTTTGEFTNYKNQDGNKKTLSNNRIWSITENKIGNIIVATSDGLGIFDPEKEIFTNYYNSQEDIHSISNDGIRNVYIDSDGLLWIGTQNGLNSFNIDTKKFTSYYPDNFNTPNTNFIVNTIFELIDGNIWVGTTSGLYEFSKKSGEFINRFIHNPADPTSLRNNDIRSIFKDESGLLWIGTRGGGVERFNPGVVFSYWGDKIDSYNMPISSGYEAIYEDSAGMVWLSRAGLFKYNPKTKKVTNYPVQNISSIVEDSNGNLWFGSNNGVFYELNKDYPGLKQYKVPLTGDFQVEENIISLYIDKKNKLWIGTYGNGIAEFSLENRKIENIYINTPGDINTISNNEIWSIYEDDKKRLWIGTSEGLNLLNRDEGTFNNYHSGFIYSILQDDMGGLWIGSRDGLNYTVIEDDKETSTAQYLKNYKMVDGLPNNMVFGILEDDEKKLWVSTEFGLSNFDPKKEIFTNYDRTDGLQSNTFIQKIYHKSKTGKLYFGGTNGVTSFFPAKLKTIKSTPPVVITDFRLFEKSIDFGKDLSKVEKIILSHEDDFFGFEFAALDYTKPHKNQFAYMLEGFDEDWIDVGTRNYITYTNLDPGNYTFHVKGSSSTGNWNSISTDLNLLITPPWWDNHWFKFFCVMTIFAIFLSIIRLRLRSLRIHSERLQKEVTLKTAQLAEKNRTLAKLVNVDGLTQIANRRYFDKTLEKEWFRLQREEKYLSLIFIDIDFFKQYNDLYGHQAGDECIKVVAKILKQITNRPTDLAARYGGEEFIVTLPNTDRDGANIIAKKIQKILNTLKIPHEKSSVSDFLTLSMGIITLIPNKNETIESTINRVDGALYLAKSQGRNKIINSGD